MQKLRSKDTGRNMDDRNFRVARTSLDLSWQTEGNNQMLRLHRQMLKWGLGGNLLLDFRRIFPLEDRIAVH